MSSRFLRSILQIIPTITRLIRTHRGWTGPTSCAAGGCCTYANAYYSQCVPCSSTTSASSTAKASSTSTKPTTTATSTHTISTTSTSSYTTTRTTTTTSTTTSTGAMPSGTQIRSDQDPTYHFYLQNDGAHLSRLHEYELVLYLSDPGYPSQ